MPEVWRGGHSIESPTTSDFGAFALPPLLCYRETMPGLYASLSLGLLLEIAYTRAVVCNCYVIEPGDGAAMKVQGENRTGGEDDDRGMIRSGKTQPLARDGGRDE